jgi:hypothetical protein
MINVKLTCMVYQMVLEFDFRAFTKTISETVLVQIMTSDFETQQLSLPSITVSVLSEHYATIEVAS